MNTQKDKQELEEDERFCFKCKRIVHKFEFNNNYEICDECVESSTGH